MHFRDSNSHRSALISTLTLLAAAFLWLPGCNKSPAPEAGAEPPAAGKKPSAALPSDPDDKTPEGDKPKTEAEELEALASQLGNLSPEAIEQIHDELTARVVKRMIEERHLRQRPMDDDISSKAFDLFVERLDPVKLYLLASDVEALEADRLQMDDQAASGKLVLAHAAGKLLTKRVARVAQIVDGLLKKPLNLDDEETFETDEEKRGWCKTDEELTERWRKALELQALYRIERRREMAADEAEEAKKAGKPAPEALDDAALVDEVQKKMASSYQARFERLQQRDRLDRTERALNALASVYDPHSTYMPPRRKEDFDIRMSGTLEGIGAVLVEDEHLIKVVRIVPGSASWRQGQLKAEDYILAVAEKDGEPVDLVDMRLRDAVRLIRGPKGTVVKLTVKKPDGERKVIPITRDVVNIEAAYAKGAIIQRKGGDRVGYVDLSSFYGDTRWGAKQTARTCSKDLAALVARFKDEGLDTIILDLRGNGGGLLGEARRIAGLFVDEGPIVQTKDYDGEIGQLDDPDKGVEFDGELIVMIDRFSASASEIVAGALQDYGRAIIVGAEATHGKGTVQSLIALDELAPESIRIEAMPGFGALKLTQQSYYRITGRGVQQKGITADIILPDPAAHIESGERFHDYPVPWDEVPPAKYTRWTVPAPDLAGLRTKSKARVDANPYFQTLTKRVALLDKRNDETVVPLSRKAFDERSKREEAELDALSLDDETARFEVKPLRYAKLTRERIKADDEAEAEWAKSLAADAWVNETLQILEDIRAARK